MAARDPNWKTEMSFLKITEMDYTQQKPYLSDGMNNAANNTKPSLGGAPYPEIIQYWNFYQTDEKIQINWIFFTYIDNLSFLGGLLDIGFLIPWIVMVGYTFRLNEINVFFYQQVMKRCNMSET